MTVVLPDSPDVATTDAQSADPGEESGRGWRTSTAVGSVFALWGLFVGISALHDNSFLTHYATGRLILDTGGIPRTDPYSFTALGEPWVVQSWLASVVYGAAYQLAGLGAVRVVVAALTTTLAVLVWRLTGPAGSLVARIGIAALACTVGIGMWVERPLLFGLVAMALVLVLVEGRGDLRLLVPVMWVWVNTHGSFPLAAVLLVLLALGRRLDRASPTRELHALGWVVAGTLLGGLNPLGPRLLVFPLELVRNSEAFREIQEWQPPHWDNPWQIAFLVQLAVALLLLARHRRWRTALPLVVFTLMAVTSARNVVVASLVMVPGMAVGAAGLGSLDGARRSVAARAATVAAVLLGVLLAVSALRPPHTDLRAYPEDAVDALEDAGMLGDRLVAPDYVGNYLEARYRGEVRVFVDDRVDMYPLAVVKDAAVLNDGAPGWKDVLERHDAGVVLWPRDEPLADHLVADDAWTVWWSDDDWSIWVPA